MAKELTQMGLNRAMFLMLKKLGGKVVISEGEIEHSNKEDAMLIQHHPADHVFVLSLHRVRSLDVNKVTSNIIIPSRN